MRPVTQMLLLLMAACLLVSCRRYDPTESSKERYDYVVMSPCDETSEDLQRIAFEDPDPEVQIGAIIMMRECEHPAYLPMLFRFLDSPHPELRSYVEFRLMRDINRGPRRFPPRYSCPLLTPAAPPAGPAPRGAPDR